MWGTPYRCSPFSEKCQGFISNLLEILFSYNKEADGKISPNGFNIYKAVEVKAGSNGF
jgi:hypothetical protein